MNGTFAAVRAGVAALLLLLSLLVAGKPAPLGAQASGPQVTITEYPLPTPDSAPGGITVGSDGALWFHMPNVNKVGRITTDGRVTEYPIPTPNSSERFQGFLATGPDGAIWFTENAKEANKIGRLALDGTFTEYPVPTPDAFVGAVTPGPDGALWFTEGRGNKIGRITLEGQITEYPVPTANSNPYHLAAGPDGTLWFTEPGANQIGRLTITRMPGLPNTGGGGAQVQAPLPGGPLVVGGLLAALGGLVLGAGRRRRRAG